MTKTVQSITGKPLDKNDISAIRSNRQVSRLKAPHGPWKGVVMRSLYQPGIRDKLGGQEVRDLYRRVKMSSRGEDDTGWELLSLHVMDFGGIRKRHAKQRHANSILLVSVCFNVSSPPSATLLRVPLHLRVCAYFMQASSWSPVADIRSLGSRLDTLNVYVQTTDNLTL